MLSDYSDLENEIVESEEPKILPRGAEVKARIIKVNAGVSDKNGARWYMPVFDVPDDPMVMEFKDFFWELSDKDKIDPKQFQRSLNKFKRFASSFDLDFTRPFDWEDDLIDLSGYIITGIKKDDEYGDQNSVAKYVVGA